MTESITGQATGQVTGQVTLDPELEEFAGQIADQIESVLVADDGLQGDQEALDLVGDLPCELLELRVQGLLTRHLARHRLSHRLTFFLRMPVPR